MNKLTIFSAAIFATSLSQSAFAQHADVEFGYDNPSAPTTIVLENDDVSSEGIQFWESDIELLDPDTPGDFGWADPGFEAALDEGLQFNPGDNIFISVLDARDHSSFGQGFVNLYNPTTALLEASQSIAVIDNTPTGTTDLILNEAEDPVGDALQFLATAEDDGDAHDHVVFDLLNDDTAPIGAYGVLLEVRAVQANGSPDVVSDPFWFILNNNLPEEDFEGPALGAFGIVETAAIPEPTSLALLFGGATCLVLRRRR